MSSVCADATEPGEVEVRLHVDGRVEVLTAPPVALMAPEVLARANPHTLVVDGPDIRLAGQVTYRVAGWDDAHHCLILHKLGDD